MPCITHQNAACTTLVFYSTVLCKRNLRPEKTAAECLEDADQTLSFVHLSLLERERRPNVTVVEMPVL